MNSGLLQGNPGFPGHPGLPVRFNDSSLYFLLYDLNWLFFADFSFTASKTQKIIYLFFKSRVKTELKDPQEREDPKDTEDGR